MSQKLKWGIIGAGTIANTFAKGVLASQHGELVAIGSRAQASADEFADKYNIPKRYASYQALLDDPDVQAVYIATLHPQHAEWAIKAARAKKHILCEKPIGLNHAEAMAIIEAARENDVFLMEAFMYRCHPLIQKLVELIRDKVIGDVRLIRAAFSYSFPSAPDHRARANIHAGGGILDVGCYPISMSRLVAGAATGKDFAEPIELKAVGFLGEAGTDEVATAVMKFPGNIIAQVSTGILVTQPNDVYVFGSQGSIHIAEPWIIARDGEPATLTLKLDAEQSAREIVVDSPAPLYAIEADTVAKNIDRRQAISPAMTWEDTLGNMRALDAWREAIGLTYELETPPHLTTRVDKSKLTVRAKHNMTYGKVPGIDLPVSRLVMGVDNQHSAPHAHVMFDDYFERGGNTFDTAYVYVGGHAEKQLGHWVRNRGVRSQIVVIGKGGHTPFCDPRNITKQLNESLERLQMDYVDLYMVHRDNPELPVGAFVDLFNELHRAGRMRAFGVSNWTIARVEEANAYAKQKGLIGLSAVSNNFALARMVEPIWEGCLASSDPASRQWFTQTQLPQFPWSSQARGFFTDRSGPELRDDGQLVRTWYSDDNFQRKARVCELAKELNAQPINVALAYVLCQPFPTFPLIGPRQLSETRISLAALDIKLTPKQLRWLNLEE